MTTNNFRKQVGTKSDEQLKFVWQQLQNVIKSAKQTVKEIYELNKVAILLEPNHHRYNILQSELDEKRRYLNTWLDTLVLARQNFNTLFFELRDEPREVTADWKPFNYDENETLAKWVIELEQGKG